VGLCPIFSMNAAALSTRKFVPWGKAKPCFSFHSLRFRLATLRSVRPFANEAYPIFQSGIKQSFLEEFHRELSKKTQGTLSRSGSHAIDYVSGRFRRSQFPGLA